MPQGVGMDVFLLQASTSGGLAAGMINGLGGVSDSPPYGCVPPGITTRKVCALSHASTRAMHPAALG